MDDVIVTLNVGGKRFRTTSSTLCAPVPCVLESGELQQHHFLAALISSQLPVQVVKGEEIFVDRDGTHFRYILNYLRSMSSGSETQYSLPFHQKHVIEELMVEATFYGLDHLKMVLESGDYMVAQETSPRGIFQDSVIIKSRKHESVLHQFLMETIREMNISNPDQHQSRHWRLVYRATQNGFTARNFHECSRKKGPTVSIMKSTDGYIFGIFISIDWITSDNKAKHDPHAFAFTLQGPNTDHPEKFSQKVPGKTACVLDYGNHGPSLSCLTVNDKFDNPTTCYSLLGHTFFAPKKTRKVVDDLFLTGTKTFGLSELEVFAL